MLNAQQNIRHEEGTPQPFSSLPCHSCHVTKRTVVYSNNFYVSEESTSISEESTDIIQDHDSDFQSGKYSIKTKQNKNIH